MFGNILRNKFWRGVMEEEGTQENQDINGKENCGIIPADGPAREFGALRQGRSNWKKETGEQMAGTRRRRVYLSYIFEYHVAGIKYLRGGYLKQRVVSSFSVRLISKHDKVHFSVYFNSYHYSYFS